MMTRQASALFFSACVALSPAPALSSEMPSTVVTNDAGIIGYEIVQSSSNADSTDVKMVRVYCPDGKKIFGGGYTINGSTTNGKPAPINNLVPTASLLFSTGGTNHDSGLYLVEVREIVPNDGDWSVTGQAICGIAIR